QGCRRPHSASRHLADSHQSESRTPQDRRTHRAPGRATHAEGTCDPAHSTVTTQACVAVRASVSTECVDSDRWWSTLPIAVTFSLPLSHGTRRPHQEWPPAQGLRDLRTALRVAQEMGTRLGERPLLQRCVSERKKQPHGRLINRPRRHQPSTPPFPLVPKEVGALRAK
ncbi:MAG: hypothetical protein RL547_555, partial [Actinomycetota bacterium]